MAEDRGFSTGQQAGLAVAIAVVMLGGLALLTNNSPPPAPAAPETPIVEATVAPLDPEKVAAFNAAIKAEPKVLDYVYDPSAVYQWTIGVKDDGSPRYGYAEYFCVLMAQHGLPLESAKVRIVDLWKYLEPGGNARDASLGSVDCATGEHMMP